MRRAVDTELLGRRQLRHTVGYGRLCVHPWPLRLRQYNGSGCSRGRAARDTSAESAQHGAAPRPHVPGACGTFAVSPGAFSWRAQSVLVNL